MPAQFLRNTQATLSVVFSSGPADAAVTATVRGEDGVVLDTGTATQVGITAEYTFDCDPQAELNRLTTTWSASWGGVAQEITTDAEIVGGHLFTVADVRTWGDRQLVDDVEYPDEAIREKRDIVTDDFQNACGVPFFPRYEREAIDGSGRSRLWLPWKRPLRLAGVTVDGVALGAPELAAITLYPTGRLDRDGIWPAGRRNVVITWERGYRQVPEPIKRAAMALTHYELVASEITDRQVSFANELGTVRLSVPGRRSPTGIPLVDATLGRYDERDVLLAVR